MCPSHHLTVPCRIGLHAKLLRPIATESREGVFRRWRTAMEEAAETLKAPQSYQAAEKLFWAIAMTKMGSTPQRQSQE
jgi:hypothetical protein